MTNRPIESISLPRLSLERLLREACLAYNLRRSAGEPLADPGSTEWRQLYAIALSFVRHNLTDYDRWLAEGAEHEELRAHIHAAAHQAYPWLRPQHDPRQRPGGSSPNPPRRYLDEVSAALCDLVSARASVLTALAKAKTGPGKRTHQPTGGFLAPAGGPDQRGRC